MSQQMDQEREREKRKSQTALHTCKNEFCNTCQSFSIGAYLFEMKKRERVCLSKDCQRKENDFNFPRNILMSFIYLFAF